MRNASERHLRIGEISLLLLCVVLCALIYVSSEEEGTKKTPNASVVPDNLDEIREVYCSLSDESAVHGNLNRHSYLLWAITSYLFAECRRLKSNKLSMTTSLTVFREKMRKHLAKLFDELRRLDNSLTPKFSELVILIAAREYFIHHPTKEFQDCVLNEIRSGYISTQGSLIERQAFAQLLSSCPFIHTLRFRTTQESGPPEIFLLNCFETPPPAFSFGNRKEDFGDYTLRNFCIKPLQLKGEHVGKLKQHHIRGFYHPFVQFEKGSPFQHTYGLFPDTYASRHRPTQSPGYCGGYFESGRFLHSYYCKEFARTFEKGMLVEGNYPPRFRCGGSAVADIRSIFIDTIIPVSGSMRIPVLPRYSSKCFHITSMLTCDHPEHSFPSAAFNDKEFYCTDRAAKYRKFRENCDFYLAALYPKTIRTKVIGLDGALTIPGVTYSSYLTPDYSCQPFLFAAMIPREWIRLAAYCRFSHVFYDYNLIGLDDLSIRNNLERQWKPIEQ